MSSNCNKTVTMIRVALLGFAPFEAMGGRGAARPATDGGPVAPVVAAFGRLNASGFALPDAELRLALAPLAWFAGDHGAVEAAAAADAVVLVDQGRAVAPFAVVASALNQADPRLIDAAGDRWPGETLAPGGPAQIQGGLDPAVFARALAFAGLHVDIVASSDAGFANRCFYSLARRGGLVGRLQIGPTCAPADLDAALRAAALFAGATAELRASHQAVRIS
jgi:hypothetical protein